MKKMMKLLAGIFLLGSILCGEEKTDTSVLYTGNNDASKYVYKERTYPGGKWNPGPAKYGYEIIKDVKVPMDDGITLNATVAYPTDLKTGKRVEGKFPVVIEHMPYEQFAVPVGVNTYFTEHGYISLFVRARGTGKSEWEVQFLSPREGQDGKNIIDWAASKLENSDGRIGLMGCSWPGAIALTDTAYAGKNSPSRRNSCNKKIF